ncbi:hypothetical protein ACFL0W_00500 [Nanoarchaeota archaeon]
MVNVRKLEQRLIENLHADLRDSHVVNSAKKQAELERIKQELDEIKQIFPNEIPAEKKKLVIVHNLLKKRRDLINSINENNLDLVCLRDEKLIKKAISELDLPSDETEILFMGGGIISLLLVLIGYHNYKVSGNYNLLLGSLVLLATALFFLFREHHKKHRHKELSAQKLKLLRLEK